MGIERLYSSLAFQGIHPSLSETQQPGPLDGRGRFMKLPESDGAVPDRVTLWESSSVTLVTPGLWLRSPLAFITSVVLVSGFLHRPAPPELSLPLRTPKAYPALQPIRISSYGFYHEHRYPPPAQQGQKHQQAPSDTQTVP